MVLWHQTLQGNLARSQRQPFLLLSPNKKKKKRSFPFVAACVARGTGVFMLYAASKLAHSSSTRRRRREVFRNTFCHKAEPKRFEVVKLSSPSAWRKDFDEIIDVRAPSEYADAHIPSVRRLPLFVHKSLANKQLESNTKKYLRFNYFFFRGSPD
jgi:hypothetical protein